jgi:hypothetical protein
VFGALSGAMTSAMICLGDRLGPVTDRSPTTGPPRAEQLARRTGLSERWVREWLHQQGAAGVLDYRGDGCFALTPEGRAVLAEEHHPAFGCGIVLVAARHDRDRGPHARGVREAASASITTRSVRTRPWASSAAFAPWYRALLVPMALPRIEGLVPALRARRARGRRRLRARASRLLEMARAFPASRFHGYEISHHALSRAEDNRRAAGATNVEFHDARREPLPGDGSFDFITTFDCLHDMTDPARTIEAIRAALARRRRVAGRRHQGARRLRGERAPQSDGGADVRHVGADVPVVGALGTGRCGARHARAARGPVGARWRPRRASGGSSRSTSGIP